MSEVPAASPQGRAAAFGFIFVSAIACAVSIGIMVPVLPNLLRQFNGGDTAAAADWIVIFNVFGGLMSFFAGPVLGLLSDRFGRRPVLLISISGLGFDFLFMAFAPSLNWLFLGRLISGATSGVFSTANAYVADITPPEKRAQTFGWMGAAFAIGFLAGPAIGGYLGDINLRLPFLAAAALTLVNALYGLFVVPESLPEHKRTTHFHWRRANPLGSLRLLRSHHELLPLAAVGFLNQLGNMVWPSVFVLYAGYRFHWTPGLTGLFMAGVSIAGVAVQFLIVGPFVRRFGERACMVAGTALPVIGLSWISYAPNGWLYLIGVPFNAFWQLLNPGLQGLMTRRVGPSEQGQLQGANQSLMGMSSVIGPIIYGLPFAWAVRHPEWHVPGLPFMIAALIMAMCLGIALWSGYAAAAYEKRAAAK
ncbi:MAG TPA: TCR/Tet family MFS transporter [Rhizomicrobium sp.]|jgi:DHA1 family tetracycline resistance protein-like MFS transporter|nr:TCR/Tet family MFS transporter [Rhizomicrobium sp.]